MKTKDSSPFQVRDYFIRGVAIASALALGAGYIWWAQARADARLAHQVDRSRVPQAEVAAVKGKPQEYKVVRESLASGSKTSQQSFDLTVVDPSGLYLVTPDGERISLVSQRTPSSAKAGELSKKSTTKEQANE